MNVKLKMCLTVCGTLFLSAAALQAQRHAHEGGPLFGGPVELMGFEGLRGGKIVKGAPFSATATSETTQVLQDGSVIHRTFQVSMYRDSQGRSRHEATFTGFGPLQASGGPKKMISISDPVAGVHYMLDGEQKVAHKMNFHEHAGSAAADSAARESKRELRLQQEEASGLLKRESLGTQTINGVVAEGTRTTRTIPVGQIGNDKPLQIVSERWYSPDLQIVLKTTRTDPRFGTTTYTVTNIQRSEPSASMFTVPADFTVQTGGLRRGGAAGRPPMEMPPPDQE